MQTQFLFTQSPRPQTRVLIGLSQPYDNIPSEMIDWLMSGHSVQFCSLGNNRKWLMVLGKKKTTGTFCKAIITQGGDSAMGNLVKEWDKEAESRRGDDRQLRTVEHYQTASVMNPGALLPLDLLEVAFFQVIEVNQASIGAKSILTNTGWIADSKAAYRLSWAKNLKLASVSSSSMMQRSFKVLALPSMLWNGSFPDTEGEVYRCSSPSVRYPCLLLHTDDTELNISPEVQPCERQRSFRVCCLAFLISYCRQEMITF